MQGGALHREHPLNTKREKIDIARCTVERLMRQLGIQGVRRGKKIKTTYGRPAEQCPLNKVNRQFRAFRLFVERPASLFAFEAKSKGSEKRFNVNSKGFRTGNPRAQTC